MSQRARAAAALTALAAMVSMTSCSALGVFNSEAETVSAAAPATVTRISTPAVEKRPDVSALPAFSQVSEGGSESWEIENADDFNALVATEVANQSQGGNAVRVVPIASSSDLVAVRYEVADSNGTPVDTFTQWYSFRQDALVDPTTFLNPAEIPSLAQEAALAFQAGSGTINGLPPVAPLNLARSLSFTPEGNLFWSKVRNGELVGFSTPTEGLLTDIGQYARDVTTKPTNPALPRPAPDCAVLKCIALTFDDGPADETPLLLDTLADTDSLATFFVNGTHIPGREAIMERLQTEGHQIGNHTQNHPRLTEVSSDRIRSEIAKTDALMEPYVGKDSKTFRPPYGLFNDNVRSIAAEQGYSLIMWSVDPSDYREKEAQPIIDKVLASAERNAIVLSHDSLPQSVTAYQTIIPELVEQGYTLVTVDELLGTTNPGELHRRG